jgi:hypothetical protein
VAIPQFVGDKTDPTVIRYPNGEYACFTIDRIHGLIVVYGREQAKQFGAYMMEGSPLDPAQLRYESITPKKARKIARRYHGVTQFWVPVLGTPVDGSPLSDHTACAAVPFDDL